MTILTMVTTTNCHIREVITSCEGSSLELTCPAGSHINIVRANYGRLSTSICPSTTTITTITTCIHPVTSRIVSARCGGRSTCSIQVSTAVFGDPCPGTHKYLEMVFTCKKQSTIKENKDPMVPPWLLELEATTAATTSTTTTTSTPSSVILRSPSKEFLRYLKRKHKEKLETKDISKVFVNVPKVIKKAEIFITEKDNTVIIAATVTLISCSAIIILSIIIIRIKNKQKTKRDTNFYQISSTMDQYKQLQFLNSCKNRQEKLLSSGKNIEEQFQYSGKNIQEQFHYSGKNIQEKANHSDKNDSKKYQCRIKSKADFSKDNNERIDTNNFYQKQIPTNVKDTETPSFIHQPFHNHFGCNPTGLYNSQLKVSHI